MKISKSDRDVWGGIVPHHNIAQEKIHQYFENISSSDCELVVLLGPNHFGIGEGEVQTSNANYVTPGGILETDKSFYKEALSGGEIKALGGAVFGQEHSITALANYIKKYFPKACLAPFIFRSSISAYQCQKTAQWLQKFLKNKKAIVLASVDFSHYLTEEMADFHDQISMGTIQSFDWENIPNLELDSWPSIYVLLKYLSLNGASRMEIFNHSNSLDYAGTSKDNVVSYVFAYFFKGDSIKQKTSGMLFLVPNRAQCLERNVLADWGRLFSGVETSLVNLEEGYLQIVGQSNQSHSVLAQKLFERNIYPFRKNGFYDPKSLGRDAEYLTKENLGFLESFLFHDGYRLKSLAAGKLGLVVIDRSRKEKMSFWEIILKKAKKEADFLAAYIYWEKGFSSKESQEESHRLIDLGADIVIGSSSEIDMEMEKYKNRIIVYSSDNPNRQKESAEKRAIGIVFGARKRDYQFLLARKSKD